MTDQTQYNLPAIVEEPLAPGQFESWVKMDRGWRMMTRGGLAHVLDDLFEFRHGHIPEATRFRIETVRKVSVGE